VKFLTFLKVYEKKYQTVELKRLQVISFPRKRNIRMLRGWSRIILA
jgi:hypothetical protein